MTKRERSIVTGIAAAALMPDHMAFWPSGVLFILVCTVGGFFLFEWAAKQ